MNKKDIDNANLEDVAEFMAEHSNYSKNESLEALHLTGFIDGNFGNLKSVDEIASKIALCMFAILMVFHKRYAMPDDMLKKFVKDRVDEYFDNQEKWEANQNFKVN